MNTICEIKNESMHGQKKDTIKRFYVYHLIDPSDNLPFYVGKGTGERMFSHEKMVRNGKIPNRNKFLFNKIKKVIEESKLISYFKVQDNVSNFDALNLEISEIKKFGRRDIKTGILCNMTDGGEGNNGIILTKFSRDKISKANKGRIITWGAKISESLRRDPSILIDRNKKISEMNKGKIVSIETKKKQSIIRMGKVDSYETRLKKSESQKKRVYSELELLKKKENGKENEKIYPVSLINDVKLWGILYEKPHNVYEILSQIYPELTYHGVRRILRVGEFSNIK